MRDIKFRFLDNEGKWYYGTLNQIIEGRFISWATAGCALDYEPPQQYTGLKDKNGKEVYEGDILFTNDDPGECKEPHTNMIVEWCSEMAKYEVFNQDNKLDLGYYPFDEIEVIGNIYENRNLLESK